jgi:hypothetical protein
VLFFVPLIEVLLYPISERGPSPKSALRITGSFAYRIRVVQYPDRPSREIPFANRDSSLIGGSPIGYWTVYPIVVAMILKHAFMLATCSDRRMR